MKKMRTIFGFEFRNYAKSKSFLILTVLLVAAAGVALSIPRLQEAFGPGGGSPAERQTVAVVDKTGTGAVVPALTAAFVDKKVAAVDLGIDALKAEVGNGKYDAAFVVDSGLHYTYVVKNLGMYDTTPAQAEEALLAVYRSQALQKLGVSPAESQKILSARMQSDVVKTADGKDQMKNFFFTYVMIFMLYMAILIYGQLVATSVATEKSTRAMELLITAARPTDLMFGKVLGAGTAGLVQLAAILGSGYVFYHLNESYYRNNEIVQSIFGMPASILLYALLFFLLGFFIYAFLYGALGSLISRMEELNQAVMPVTFLFIIAFMIVMFSMGSGQVDNPLMVALSYIPLTSPMAMFVRIAMGNVAGWEVALSVLILVASTVGIGFLAAAIYRMGVLLYGKPPKPGEIVAMLRNSK